VGVQNARTYLDRYGFTVLYGQYLRSGGLINLAEARKQEARGLDERDSGLYTMSFKHRPTEETVSLGRFEFQLSGHTHRGHIFPFNYVTGAVYPMQDGLYHLEDGSSPLYISRGSGTWGSPLRIGAPPEVTVIELRRGLARPTTN